MTSLPIDEFLPHICASLRAHSALVLTAEPGAGKTTRVPGALLDAGLAGERQVVVLEPRRIAARAAAAFVARERGGRLGDEVGYRVRFDERGGRRTRLWFVTEGILTRMLASDPYLDEVGVVVLDEFHERHLQGDLALAVLRALQQTVRPELKLVVMSATLQTQAPARFLGDCPVVSAPGRAHPVAIEWSPEPRDTPLAPHVARVVARVLAASAGDVLVFLPGAGEIRRCAEALASLAAEADLLLVPLHGDLPSDEQDAALRPAARRKVILATNVAESSVTVDGVSAVVDAGLVRVLRHDPRRGLDVLRVEKISRSSAEQRAGRAGRQGPGLCVRLWAREEHGRLPEAETPEIRRVDLAGAVLELAAWGEKDPAAFGWFEAPPASALARAVGLLRALGATGPGGEVTETGRRMLRFGVGPRLARMMVAAVAEGCARAGALLAALAGERDICLETRVLRGGRDRTRTARTEGSGSSDLLARAELFGEAEAAHFAGASCRELELDPGALRAVVRTRDALARAAGSGRSEGLPTGARLLRCVLAGFPDRVARRKAAGGREALMVGGMGVRLAEESVVRDSELFVAVDLDARGHDAWATVRQASAIERPWLGELFPDSVSTVRELVFDAQAGRVVELRSTRFSDLVLEETRGSEVDAAAAGELLAREARKDPRRVLGDDPELDRVLARARWLMVTSPELGLPPLDDAWLGELAAELCAGVRAFREVVRVPVLAAVRARLGHEHARLLDREAPDRIQLPSSRHARVLYESGKEPAVAARLQEFFGLHHVPRIGGGKVAIVLELLAPNHRPVQVTKDLPSFWANVYPKIRTELRRRYPRHSWPEDPLTALPEARPKRRQ